MEHHVLVFPYPIYGHFAPLHTFSLTLASLGISVTLVHTQANLKRILLDPLHPPYPPPSLHLLDIPDGLPLDFDRNTNYQAFFTSIQHMGSAFHQLVHSLHQSSPITCIISDPHFPWVQNVANLFNIPRFLFVTDSAAVFSTYLHAQRLLVEGFLGNAGSAPKDSTKLIDFIPGVPPLHRDDLPFPKPQISEMFFKLRTSMFEGIAEVAGVLLNTFYELEREAVDGARAHLSLPILPVGPSLPKFMFTDHSTDHENQRSDPCLQWLNGQPPSSVLYVSFGSLAALTESQIQEIADGLKASGQPFLWVIRSGTDSILSQNFLMETRGQGLVVSWAPQLQVLSHSAVGAFMTHCGWNSVIESITAGVPMLCCPHFLDQPMNCKYVVEEWNVGVRLEGSVEGLVKMIFASEEGKLLKKRAVNLRNAAKLAVCQEPIGSSTKYLDDFVKLLSAMNKKT